MAGVLPVTETMREAPVFDRVAVVGCGLIGGSIALATRRRWPDALVVAVDRQPVVEAAMRLSAIDSGGDDLALVAGADLVVLAAPVATNVRLLEDLSSLLDREAVVTDDGGTKRTTEAAATRLPANLRFVGGHPLAGAANGGVEQARPDLFEGRPWILTPGGDEEAEARVARFVTALGAVPRRMSSDDHDRLLAYLSHLPQLTASALMHVVGEHVGTEGLGFAGRGLRDTTRLAASPSDIWQDVVSSNRDHVTAALDDLIAVLSRLRDGAPSSLPDVFASAAAWKRRLSDEPSS
jgi:prephenate dehydrogenase